MVRYGLFLDNTIHSTDFHNFILRLDMIYLHLFSIRSKLPPPHPHSGTPEP